MKKEDFISRNHVLGVAMHCELSSDSDRETRKGNAMKWRDFLSGIPAKDYIFQNDVV